MLQAIMPSKFGIVLEGSVMNHMGDRNQGIRKLGITIYPYDTHFWCHLQPLLAYDLCPAFVMILSFLSSFI